MERKAGYQELTAAPWQLGPHRNVPGSGNPPRDSMGPSRSGWLQRGRAPTVLVTVGAVDHTEN